VLIAANVVPAYGADATPLLYRTAAIRTLKQHPELRAWALQLLAADARREQANLRPIVELNSSVEGAAGTGTFSGVDGAEISIGLSTLVERGGKRQARIAVAEAARAVLDADRQVVALDLLAETGRRFVAAVRARERVRVLRLALAQAEQTVALVMPRVRSARSPRTELLDAQMRLSAARVAVANADRSLQAARTALGAQWNDFELLQDPQLDLLSLPTTPPFAELEKRIESVPDLSRFASESQLRTAELRLVQSQAVADWQWAVGARRYQADGEQALLVGFSVPLGLAKRTEPFAREAQAQRERVEQQAASARLRLKLLLSSQLQLLASARARVTSISNEELPRMREALEITERGYRMGKFPYRELVVIQTRITDLELARDEAAAEFHLINVEAERLVGAQLELLSESMP
jgi:cobalt-zinc-cadmium efflux system outer membrane protein